MSETTIAGCIKYPHLFEPIRIGNRMFKNRIFCAPIGYANMKPGGHINEGAEYHYGRRALGGAASVSTQQADVDCELGAGYGSWFRIDQPDMHIDLGTIAHAISQHGAVPTIELQHNGMFANRALGMHGVQFFGPAYGPVEVDQGGRIVQAMDDEIINRTINKFIDAAVLGARAGFGMVLIHAGHGWGLHQFMSPLINTRKDEWGGSPENRCRIVTSIIDGIHHKLGRGFPVEVRMSGSECYDGGFDIDVGIENAMALDGHANLIQVSAGNHEVDEVFTITHPSMFRDSGCNVHLAAEIKKYVEAPVATLGGLSEPEMLEEIIASGKADVVEMARELLCEPDFPNLVRMGREDEAKRCMRCLSCFSNEMNHGSCYCAINPTCGREREAFYELPAVKVKKRVLVIGGGAAGMEAALDCAKRGHDVILCEKEAELGGVLRCERDVDFKQNLDYYLDQQQRKCMEHPNIEVRLGCEVTPQMAQELNMDVVVPALGSKPAVPPVPGIGNDNVIVAVDAYKNPDKLGEKTVIMGAGLVGIELGLHLRKLGKNVEIVEMLDHISDGGNFLHTSGLRVEIAARELPINFQNRVREIAAGEVVCDTPDGEKRYAADTIIVAMGMRPLDEEAAAFYQSAPEYYPIGDCVVAKNLEAATTGAYTVARDLGRF